MLVTWAPMGRGRPNSAAIAGPNFEFKFTPRNARVTLPVSINCRPTTMNMLMGMAKPIPRCGRNCWRWQC